MKAALYGLRPVITGIILYAAVSIALKNSIIGADSAKLIEKGFNISFMGVNLFEAKSIVIVLTTFLILIKTKIHPIFVITGAGLIGTVLF